VTLDSPDVPTRLDAPRPSRALALVTWLVLELAAVWGLAGSAPPRPRDESTPAASFSAARALRHVARIAAAPHPAGSSELARVRTFILWSLLDLGLAPSTQTVESIAGTGPDGTSVPLENIVCRIPGSDSTGAVLLAAHYDSVATGPGAADDAAAVAAILEALRASRAGPPLRNDVIVLFTDGEEQGLRGARGFVDEHPAAADVRVAINLEARGNSGPSILFETSDRNGRLIEEYAAAVERPVASSLGYEIYKRLPNDTDFTVFREAGIRGLNFAFIDGVSAYHSQHDTPENLSAHSLEHHGEQVLALARRFGGIDLRDLDAPDRVFFNLPFGVLAHYSHAFARFTAVLIAGLVLAALVAGLRRGELTLRSIARGFVETVVMLRPIAIAALALWGAHRGLARAGCFEVIVPRGETFRGSLVTFGLWNVLLALSPLSTRRFRCTGRFLAPIAAILIAGTIALLVAVARAPATSYLLAWPLLFAALSFAWLTTRGAASWSTPRAVTLGLLTCVPIVALVVPHAGFFLSAAAPNPPIAIAAALVTSSYAGLLLLPQFRCIDVLGARVVTAASAALALASFAAAIV